MSALPLPSLNNGSHPLASGMHIMGVAVLLAGCLMFSEVQANILPVDPPTLANLASATPTLYSRAIANSTFYGTLQQSCTGIKFPGMVLPGNHRKLGSDCEQCL